MAKRYYIDLSRKEIARASYFPALELKNKTKAEWLETVLIPSLLPVARRNNKKIREIPITFWAFTRQTARSFQEEIFLLLTPADPGTVAGQVIEGALQNIPHGKVFAGLESIPENAFPICQIFRGKLIRFYYSAEDVEEYYLPAFNRRGDSPAFTLYDIDKSKTLLENRDSEILFMRAKVDTVMNGEYYRKFQQALDGIGMEA